MMIKNGKFALRLVIALAITATLGVMPSAQASHGEGQPPTVCSCFGGGGFPGPFDGANLKVELSDGDLYALQGTVVFLPESGSPAAPYFQVDLKMHPWLANSHRKNSPYYPLLGAASFWQKFENQVVQLSTQAQGMASYDAKTGTASYDISLLPIAVYVAPCEGSR